MGLHFSVEIFKLDQVLLNPRMSRHGTSHSSQPEVLGRASEE
jgi:hypothetical protein